MLCMYIDVCMQYHGFEMLVVDTQVVTMYVHSEAPATSNGPTDPLPS